MPHNYLRETPSEHEARVKRDADRLYAIVYGTDGSDTAEIQYPEARKFMWALHYDFVNGPHGRETTEEYIRDFHKLGNTVLQGVR